MSDSQLSESLVGPIFLSRDAHSCDLARINQIPIALGPNDKQVLLIVRRGHIFGMVHKEALTRCEMHLKWPKRSPGVHLS